MRSSRRRIVVWVTSSLAAMLVAAAVIAFVVPHSPSEPEGIPTGAVPTGDAVPKATTSQSRYGALDGSATHLLMATETRNTGVPVIGREDGRTRSVLRSDGLITPVPPNWQVSLLGDVPVFLHLDTVPGNLAKLASISWRLPDTNQTGDVSVPTGAGFLTTAPGGWVLQARIGFNPARGDGTIQHLTRYTTSGAKTDLGVPFPDGAPFAVETTDAGILAWSFPSDGGDSVPDGKIKYRLWSGGGWRVMNPKAPEQAELLCTQPSTTLVACSAESALLSRVYSLPGGATNEITPPVACDSPSVATATGFLTIEHSGQGATCRDGRLVFIAKDGTITKSSRIYDRLHSPVLAFGRIIVDENREHRLLALRGVQDPSPQVIAGR